MSDIVIRDATKEDILELYGYLAPMTMRAWAVVWKGRLAGICCVLTGEVPTIGMKLRDDLDAPSLTVYKCSKRLLSAVVERYPVLYALCDVKAHGSAKFLSKLGFRFIRREGDMEVHQWQTQ